MAENMSMTNAQYDSMLETLARLIEERAIVRKMSRAGKSDSIWRKAK